jgi:excisionase family DNA binding protein
LGLDSTRGDTLRSLEVNLSTREKPDVQVVEVERAPRSANPKDSVQERGEGTLLTERETARKLGITDRRVRQLRYDGDLAGVQIGGLVRYEQSEVEAFIERNRLDGPRPKAPTPSTLRKRPRLRT